MRKGDLGMAGSAGTCCFGPFIGSSGTKHGVGEIAEEMNQGVGLVGGLFALSEKYPNLSADLTTPLHEGAG